MASDGGGESSYDSDFMDEEAFNRYLEGQSDFRDSASEVGDMGKDTNINQTTALPLEEPPLSLVDDTHPTENSPGSANQKPFVLPDGAVVIDLDTWDDNSIICLFGGEQSSRVKEEPQDVATASIPKHLSGLPQEQSAQKNRTNDTSGDRPVTLSPTGNSSPSAGEDKDAIRPQVDVEQYGATNVYGSGLPSTYVPRAYNQPTVEENEDIKNEEEVQFVWENLSKEIYTIPDDDDETLDEPLPVTLTSSSSGTPRSFSEVHGSNTAPTSKALPTAVPKKTFLLKKKVRPACSPAQDAKFKELSKQLAEKAVSNSTRGGAGTVFGGRGLNAPTGPACDEESADPHAWMHEVVDVDDEDAAKKFSLLKKKYNFKKRKNQTTFEEDAAFLRADKLERARLKRLDIQSEMTIVDGEEEQLFVSPDFPIQKPLKPIFAVTVESDNDDDDLMGGGGDSSMANKRFKHNPSRKKLDEHVLNETYLAALNSEMANVEAEGQRAKKNKPKGQKIGTRKNISKPKAARGGQHSSGDTAAKTKNLAKPKSKGAKGKANPKKPDLLRNINSLFDSDLYTEANAALSSAPLPLMTATKKPDALKQLIASVPLEDQRVASKEKQHILRATITLAPRRVKPDGHGGWNLKGMISPLKHHQVQGAAWMRERELGVDEPLGGLVADEMGFGKTIQMLACMIANPPPPGNLSKATLIVATSGLLSQWREEILKHVQPKALGPVIKYHAGSRLMGDDTGELMQHAGIVLTTL